MSKFLSNEEDKFGKGNILKGDRSESNLSVGSKIRNAKKDIMIALFSVVAIGVVSFMIYATFFVKEEVAIQPVLAKHDMEQFNIDSGSSNAIEKAKNAKAQADSLNEMLANSDIKQEEEAPPETPPETPVKVVVEVHDVSEDNFVSQYNREIMERKFGGEVLLQNNAIVYEKPQVNKASVSYEGGTENYMARGTNDMLNGDTFGDGYAEKLKIPLDFLLPSGTALSCVLKTKVVSDYKGLVLCQLSRNIYSANGKNLLVRKGAVLEGIQNEAVLKGSTRIFITWSQIRDADTVIRVDALGTDTLGASGVPAWVDNHFWDRFGNAMLLSFYSDAVKTGFTHLKKNTGSDSEFSTSSMEDTASTMVNAALQGSADISPTGVINQGTLMNVLVPRNVDFSKVYQNVSIKR